jgi:hypothetical protein
LNGFVNDTVDDGQSVEVEGHSWNGTVSDLLVVLIEFIKECRAIVLEAVREDHDAQDEDVRTPP